MEPTEIRDGLLLLLFYDSSQIPEFEEKLRGYGFHNIVTCTHSVDALEKLSADDFSVVITDTELKDDHDAIDTGRRIREEHHAPLIYISRLQDEETLRRALETRPAAFLTRPVNWIELRMAVESAIYQSRERSSLIDMLEEQRIMFDEAPLPCQTLSADGRLTSVNKAWSELMGYNPDKAIGRRFSEFIPIKFQAGFDQFFRSLQQNKSIHPGELDLVRKDGRDITITLSGKCHYNRHGNFIAIHCILNDISERKRLQFKLEESEERFRILFEEAPLGYQSLASNGEIIYVNSAWCNLLGYSKKETEGKWFGEFLTPKDQERFKTDFSEFKRTGEAYNIEYKMIRKDGGEIYVIIDGKVRYGEEGNYIQSHCILKDITAQKLAEKALRDSEIKFRNLIESAGDIIYILDKNLEYLYGNSQFLKRRGVTQEELTGRKYTDLHSDENIDGFREKIKAVNESGKPVVYEYLSDADGRYFLRTISPVMDPETNKFETITVISRDITGLKNTDEALRKRENEIRTITDNIPALVSYVDANGHYRFVNRQYERWFGLPAKKITGKHCREVLGEIAYKQIKEYIEKVLSGVHVSYEDALDYEHGGKRWVSAEYIPDFDAEGRVAGFFALVTDITERKKIETELLLSKRMLRTVLDTIPAAVFWKDHGFLYLGANRNFLNTIGLNSAEEIVGKSDFDLPWKKEQATSYRKDDSRVMESGIAEFNIVEPYTKKDGSPAWARTNKVPLRNEEGNIIGVLGTYEDITDLKKAEEALHKSQAQLANAMETARLGYWEYDIATDQFTFNDHFYSVFRSDVKHAGGYTMSSERYARLFVHPDDRHMVSTEIRNALETMDPNYSRQIEHRIIYADGETGYITVRFFIIKDDQGRTIRTFGANQDITERKQMEEKLRESEEKYRLLFEHAGMGIGYYNTSGEIVSYNRVAAENMGGKPEDFIGKTLTDLLGEAGKKFHERINMTLITNKTYEFEDNVYLPTGNKYNFSIYSPVVSEYNEVLGVQIISHDITERKKVESELRDREEMLRSINENISDIIWRIDSETKLSYLSPSVEKILGYKPAEILGLPLINFIAAEYHDSAVENIRKRATQKKKDALVYFEYEMVAKDGKRVPIEVTSSAIRDENGNLTGFAGVTRDISDRKATEKSLKESETRYKDLVEKAGIAIMTDDVDGRITYFNNEFAKLFGYSFAGIKGQSRETLINPKDLAKMDTYHKNRIMGKKAPARYELRGIRKGGDEIWFEVKATLLKDQEKITGTRNYIWDITEQKQMIKALTNSETRFRELFSCMTSGVAILEVSKDSSDFIIKNINEAGLKIASLTDKSKLIGKSLSDLFPDTSGTGIKDVVERVFKSGKPEKLPAVHYKDKRLELYIDYYIYKLPTGEIITVFEDITGRIKDQLALTRNFDEIKKLSRHLETVREEERKLIAGNLHDDLGQIMTAVKMDVSWIKNKIPGTKKEIMRRAETTLQIIDQAIHSIRRISSELRPSILDDLGLFEALIAHIHEYENRSNIKVCYKFPKKEPGIVPEQEISIFRIVQEALTNTARHSGATTVSLHISKKNNNLEIFISDNGTGIADNKVTSTDSFGLIGMRERVLQWGGDITIKGFEHRGTHINLSIPIF